MNDECMMKWEINLKKNVFVGVFYFNKKNIKIKINVVRMCVLSPVVS